MANGVPLEVKESPYLDFPRGKELLGKYTESFAKYGDKAKQVLGKLSFNGDLITGSSPFMAVQLGQFADLATPAQVMFASERQPDFFRGTYSDMGLVLRTDGDDVSANDYIAKNLFTQVKARGLIATSENPVRISLKGAKLKEDASSAYGLVFDLNDAEVIAIPEFAHKNNGKSFMKADGRGVPIFDNSGSRNFYSRNSGLSRLCLDWGLNLWSDDVYLASSDSGGRVPLVVASAAGSAQNLGNYTPEQIHVALEALKFSGLESALLTELNKQSKN